MYIYPKDIHSVVNIISDQLPPDKSPTISEGFDRQINILIYFISTVLTILEHYLKMHSGIKKILYLCKKPSFREN